MDTGTKNLITSLLIIGTLIACGDGQAEYEKGRAAYEQAAYDEAFEWYGRAARKGDTAAMLAYGSMYDEHYHGQRIDPNDRQDYTQAYRWYNKAAAKGSGRAMHYLGILYDMGWGVEQNTTEAAAWHKRAVETGYLEAATYVSYHYLEGRGVEQSYAQSLEWLLKAAEKGNRSSILALAELYDHHGDELREQVDSHIDHYAEMLKWYEKAAGMGHVKSMIDAAWMYETGKGTPIDMDKALMWYRKAKATGEEEAWAATEALKRLERGEIHGTKY